VTQPGHALRTENAQRDRILEDGRRLEQLVRGALQRRTARSAAGLARLKRESIPHRQQARRRTPAEKISS